MAYPLPFGPRAFPPYTQRRFEHPPWAMRSPGLFDGSWTSGSPMSSSGSSSHAWSSPAACHEQVLASLPVHYRQDYMARVLSCASDNDLRAEINRRAADSMNRRKVAAEALIHMHTLPVISPGSTPPEFSSSVESIEENNMTALTRAALISEQATPQPLFHGSPNAKAWKYQRGSDPLSSAVPSRGMQGPKSPLLPPMPDGRQSRVAFYHTREDQHHSQLPTFNRAPIYRSSEYSSGSRPPPTVVQNKGDGTHRHLGEAPLKAGSRKPELSSGFGRPLPPIPTEPRARGGSQGAGPNSITSGGPPNTVQGRARLARYPPTLGNGQVAAASSSPSRQGHNTHQRRVGRQYYSTQTGHRSGSQLAQVSVDKNETGTGEETEDDSE